MNINKDALKFHKKLNNESKELKYFAINYKDEEVKVFGDELYSNPDYRIVNIL